MVGSKRLTLYIQFPMANDYDRLIKENILAIFPNLCKQHLNIEVAKTEQLKEHFPKTLERIPDFVQKVTTTQGEQVVVHLEFQSQDDPKMLVRMQTYHNLISEYLQKQKMRVPIAQFVIYLGQAPSQMETKLPPKQVFTGYSLIELRNFDPETLLQANNPEEVILTILSNFGQEDAPKMLIQIIERLQKLIGSSAALEKYTYQLLILARLRNLTLITEQTLKDMPITYDIKEDPLYQAGRQEGKQEGIFETALNMKKEGVPVEQISKYTGLTKAQIDQLE